jgi:quinoprotein glucose dehydrogenase
MLRGAVRLIAAAMVLAAASARGDEPGWPYYGGDAGGQRFSTATQITPGNVGKLTRAWSFSNGDLASKGGAMRGASFEVTPILNEGKLFLCSPFDEVSALDPGSGHELWRFDPHIDSHLRYPNSFVCRGVAWWHDPRHKGGVCASRIFVATNDRRLIALDAGTGKPCVAFGRSGTITIVPQPAMIYPTEVQFTSGPIVTHGLVIVGSSIGDNERVNEPRGTVYAFDAASGKLRWSFDSIPRDAVAPNAASWSSAGSAQTGAANVWAPMSADEQLGLVFLPTTSPSPDFYGGERPGDNRYADSIVALHVETGRVAWSFQIVHHDVWDYDAPAQPTLGLVTYRGETEPAVIEPTKQGLVFTLNRTTGEPLIPVEERRVPQGGAPGEELSPTQPFPIAPKALAPHWIKPADAWGLTWYDRGQCRNKIAGARAQGLYTPPSLRGTIIYPFTGGGTNWGGVAFDPRHDIAYVNTSSVMHLVTLIPRSQFAAEKRAHPDVEITPQTGTPYGMKREIITSPFGLPCNPPPWGMLHAIDMHDGHIFWEVPLGTTADLLPLSEYFIRKSGTPNLGGPIVTAGGLVFVGAAMDDYLRAFDARTGAELWRGRLPAGGQATPMTYVWKGRQYVVIAAGGHAKLNTKRGDSVIAFALPR